MRYPRDMHGYGAAPPVADWPGGARIAVQIVLNYEEGGESCLLHGDDASEAFLSEIADARPWPGQRHWNMESLYEYGARAGFWRLHRLFTDAGVPVTVFGVATALARSPAPVRAMQEAGWEIASHGLKWIEYGDVAPDDERAHLEAAIRLHTEVTGSRPLGWYTGRCSVNTLDLVSAEGGFAWAADSYADDLPWWRPHGSHQQLIIPYTLDANDMRFSAAPGFSTGGEFFDYLRDSFDALYAEGVAGVPKMMSVGVHCRLSGRPGRINALARFIKHAKSHKRVWFARRIEIAEHWRAAHPPPSGDRLPSGLASTLDRETFMARFGGVFERSDWIAASAFDGELGPANDTAAGLHAAFARVFRGASDADRLTVLTAHPDLAGKDAHTGALTTASESEQTAAGLMALSAAERARFAELNDAYRAKFGFPFILAVSGRRTREIPAAIETRLNNSRAVEFAEACRQVEHIALLRLNNLLPA